MTRAGIVVALGLLTLGLGTSRAELVIDIESTTIAPGGTASANVYLYSNLDSSILDVDTLTAYEYFFQITPAPGATGQVLFTDETTYADLFSVGNYVFQDGSGQYDMDSATHVGELADPAIGYPGSTFSSLGGGDNSTNIDGYITVPKGISSKLLLTTLTFATGNGSLTPSGTFFVDLVINDSLSGYASSFSDADFNDFVPSAIQSNQATITVQDAAAVPEPGTLTLLGLGLLTIAGYRFRFRRAG